MIDGSMNPRLPPMAPRTRLYHLEPIGVGTPVVESLTGYVMRLAEAHCVSTSALVTGEVLPAMNPTTGFLRRADREERQAVGEIGEFALHVIASAQDLFGFVARVAEIFDRDRDLRRIEIEDARRQRVIQLPAAIQVRAAAAHIAYRQRRVASNLLLHTQAVGLDHRDVVDRIECVDALWPIGAGRAAAGRGHRCR